MKNFEFFEHTADVGLRLQRPTREQLFVDAARGMVELIAPNNDWHPKISKFVRAEGEDDEQLLVNWLSELNFLFQTELLVPVEFRSVKMTASEIRVELTADRVHPDVHNIELEVKAVTYHKISVKQENDTWTAQVIFDI